MSTTTTLAAMDDAIVRIDGVYEGMGDDLAGAKAKLLDARRQIWDRREARGHAEGASNPHPPTETPAMPTTKQIYDALYAAEANGHESIQGLTDAIVALLDGTS